MVFRIQTGGSKLTTGSFRLVMSSHISRLYTELRQDDWRHTSGFSPELAAVQDEILQAMSDPKFASQGVVTVAARAPTVSIWSDCSKVGG